MGLQSDIKELRTGGARLPTLGKLFFGITTLMSFITIASLADGIVKFRGFIRDVVDFYRSGTEPIRYLVWEQLDILYSTYQID